jgi:hypothetical protein
LKVNFIKVKGHSGNKWNDKADELAKAAILQALMDTSYILKFKLENIGWDFNFITTWNNCILDRNIRQFNRFIGESLLEYTWIFNSTWKDIWDDEQLSNNYQWNVTWNSFASLSHFRCKSFKTHNIFASLLKTTQNLLPTINNLKKKTALYDNIKCSSCQSDEESLTHLITCPSLKNNWQLAENQAMEKILKKIKKFLHSRNLDIKYNNSAIKQSILEHHDPAFQGSEKKVRTDLLKGLTSSSIITKLARITSRALAIQIMEKFTIIFHKAFWQHVWLPRCENMIKLEQSLGITEGQKRKPIHRIADSTDINIHQPTLASQQSKKEVTKAGITRCINAISLAIIKGLIIGWKGIKSNRNKKQIIAE